MENFKLLNQEEMVLLVQKAKSGDHEAKNKLLQGNFPLIKSVVKKYIGRGVDYDDLYQIGCVGFLKAINNFNSCFDVKFTTYAVPMIAGEIKRFLRDDGEIKISRAIKTLSIKIRSFIDDYKNHKLDIQLEGNTLVISCEKNKERVLLGVEPLECLYHSTLKNKFKLGCFRNSSRIDISGNVWFDIE